MRKKWTNQKSVTTDGKTPMQRLLESADDLGRVSVYYEQQWKTYFKAERLGYLDDDGVITNAGKEFISKGDCDGTKCES